MSVKRKVPADKVRADTTFGGLLADPDAIRGGTALAMMLEIIAAHRNKRSPEPGAILYWGTMFDAWIADREVRTLDELLELDGTTGQEPIRAQFNRDRRDMLYMENMALLVGADFTVREAATLIVDHGESGIFKGLAQYRIPEPRTLIDLFQKYGGKEWARGAGFFSDDPTIKALRDKLLKQIPNKLLPDRFR